MMNRVLAFLAPIVVLLAALVGLLGDSRVDGVTGLAGLTPLGWSTAGLAAVSTAIALYFVYRSHGDLEKARQDRRRIHAIAHESIRKGVTHLRDVLKFGALMRYTVRPYHADKEPRPNPHPPIEKGRTLLGYDVDLRGELALEDLSIVFLHPSMKLGGPYLPAVVPFGTDVVRPALTIIADEAAAAKQMLESALQMYAATDLGPDVFEAASSLLNAPFLAHLIDLNAFWHRRYEMEDLCHVPEITRVSVVDSGASGGSRRDYLQFLDALDQALAVTAVSPP